VYQIENSRQVLESGRRLQMVKGRLPGVARNVVLLGITSMFTDISAEMVNTILPLYLVFTLGLAPLQFGVIDGIYQGGSVLVRIASGFISDRWRSPKLIAASGYALSAITKPAFLLAHGAASVTGLIILDRIGKGIRTAPRDALISQSSQPGDLGIAFGVHRALDTAGAMIGPLLAFGLLLLTPNSFDAVFVVSFCIALIGLGVLTLLVRDQPDVEAEKSQTPTQPPMETPPQPVPKVSLREALGVLAEPRFRVVVIVGSALGLFTVSDAFVYLVLQRRFEFAIGYFPLLYVATALVYMLLAVPFGHLADRFGRGRIFVAGYLVLAVVYASLLLPALGPAQVLISLGLLGAYYAMTDGVLSALSSGMLPPHVLGSGLGIMASATGVTRLLASVLFGLAWTFWDIQGAVGVFLVALLVCALPAAVLLGRRNEQLTHA
jgi:MFS family permease